MDELQRALMAVDNACILLAEKNATLYHLADILRDRLILQVIRESEPIVPATVQGEFDALLGA